MTAEKYAEVLRRLDAAGQAAPEGRIHHASYGSPEALCVVDIWDTPERLEAFGLVLMPILDAVGVETGAPTVSPIHNVIR